MTLKKNDIIVSVIVLTYNQEDTVGRTLDSICNQHMSFPFEVIIGEDASSDSTREICERYACKYPDIIHMLSKEPNKGVLKNYIDCVSITRGRYVAACAGDDWWHNPEKLQMQVDFMEANPDYGMVHTDFDTFFEKSNKTIKASLNRTPAEGNVFTQLLRVNTIVAATCLYRRELLRYVDFDDYAKAGITIEDYPMWLEMSRHTKIHYINHSTITYSMLDNSISHSTDLNRQMKFIDQVYLIQQYFLEKYPQSDFSKEWLEAVYHRTRYMMLLEFKSYKASFVELPYMGFSKVVQIMLRTYCGAIICRFIIRSKLYKRIKGY